MTAREAIESIRKTIELSCEGGFYEDEQRQLDAVIARLGAGSKIVGEAAVTLTEIKGYIRSLSSSQGMRRYGGQYQKVRAFLLTALDTLEYQLPTED